MFQLTKCTWDESCVFIIALTAWLVMADPTTEMGFDGLADWACTTLINWGCPAKKCHTNEKYNKLHTLFIHNIHTVCILYVHTVNLNTYVQPHTLYLFKTSYVCMYYIMDHLLISFK
jgi:hypothetical protein